MTTLVLGATGATGRLLVAQLLERGEPVRAIVRSLDRLPDGLANHPRLSLIGASVGDLHPAEFVRHVTGCDAVASCLGHTMSFRGIYGPPRWLVTDTTRRFCGAIRSCDSGRPTRFVLMNSAGVRNPGLDPPVSFAQKCVIGVLRVLVPPHRDNERAAHYLRTEIGRDNPAIEWAAVRPDTLVNEAEVSDYQVHAAPTRSAIFDAGRTSRINVAHFMARLVTDDATWNRWRGLTPVIYG